MEQIKPIKKIIVNQLHPDAFLNFYNYVFHINANSIDSIQESWDRKEENGHDILHEIEISEKSLKHITNSKRTIEYFFDDKKLEIDFNGKSYQFAYLCISNLVQWNDEIKYTSDNKTYKATIYIDYE